MHVLTMILYFIFISDPPLLFYRKQCRRRINGNKDSLKSTLPDVRIRVGTNITVFVGVSFVSLYDQLFGENQSEGTGEG